MRVGRMRTRMSMEEKLKFMLRMLSGARIDLREKDEDFDDLG